MKVNYLTYLQSSFTEKYYTVYHICITKFVINGGRTTTIASRKQLKPPRQSIILQELIKNSIRKLKYVDVNVSIRLNVSTNASNTAVNNLTLLL